MMHMTFYWGREVTILFDSWRTKSWVDYSLSLVACLLAAAFYQYLENHRMRVKIAAAAGSAGKGAGGGGGESGADVPLIQRKFGGSGKWSAARVVGAALFGLNSAIGYMLMLAVMSFNGGVFVAVVVGLGIGYLLFRGVDDESVLVADETSCACA